MSKNIFSDENIDKIYKSSFTFDDKKEKLFSMRENGLKRGAWLGFSSLDEFYSLKRGSTSYILASPASGKTAWLYELVCNLIDYSQFNVVIWSPETGSAEDIMNELMWSHARLPFIRNKAGLYASDSDVRNSMRVLNKHIRILDFGRKEVNLSMIYNEVERLQEDDKFNVDLLIIDPYTEIAEDSGSLSGLREDEKLGRRLSAIARNSSAMDVHTMIAVHVNNLGTVMGEFEDGEQRPYVPPPLMTQVAGGQAWSRRGNMIVSIFRPPVGLLKSKEIGTDGVETKHYFKKNDSVLTILKTKPKVVGKIGAVHFKFDPLSSRFLDDWGMPSCPCPNGFEEREISPNLDQSIVAEQKEINVWNEKESDDIPF